MGTIALTNQFVKFKQKFLFTKLRVLISNGGNVKSQSEGNLQS